MSDPKANCLKCGAEFLQATVDRTGGFCMRCAVRQNDGSFGPPTWALTRPKPRPWAAILGEIQTREDLFEKQGQEMLGLQRDQLPIPVAHWTAAFSLMLGLGNGWATIVDNNLDDLVPGVAGFEECDFEPGVRGGKEAMDLLDSYELDWKAPDFSIEYSDDPLEVGADTLSESAYNDLYDALRQLDERVISDTWRAFGDLEARMILRAQELAASAK